MGKKQAENKIKGSRSFPEKSLNEKNFGYSL